MQIDSAVLSQTVLMGSYGVALPLVGAFARRIGWRRLATSSSEFHLWAICAVGLMVLWSVRTGVTAGPALHVLGVTTVTLVLGVPAAALITFLAQGVTSFIANDVTGLPMNWLISSVVPITVTELWRRLTLRCLPHDPFAFIFGAAFFGAALAVAAAYLVGLAFVGEPGMFRAGAVPSWGAMLLLVGFPEAFINGAMVTLLVVYVPERLAGYDPAYRVRHRL
ncbi:MAG: hypothetical protein AMJ59_00980 [Gammaproteobacteria bacterium SG8_31]|jgi:uncharacterized membrane protein|nr:MAG: hypothetical protein AMJ59_00980 [Gammaproteobacteria bacterium SG8_31]